jgi:hypothetical protein
MRQISSAWLDSQTFYYRRLVRIRTVLCNNISGNGFTTL